jgi:hypothetical protein
VLVREFLYFFFGYTFGPFFFFPPFKKSYRTVHYVIYKFLITYTVVTLMTVKLYVHLLVGKCKFLEVLHAAADLIICVTPAVRVFACHSFDLSTYLDQDGWAMGAYSCIKILSELWLFSWDPK